MQPLLEKDNNERIVVNSERIKYWLSVGAKATDRVDKLLAETQIIEKPVIRDTPKKSAPKKKAQERVKAKNAEAYAGVALEFYASNTL